ncbi:hypothetical protein PBRA_001144, partial [Plasmodiophora brassicae]
LAPCRGGTPWHSWAARKRGMMMLLARRLAVVSARRTWAPLARAARVRLPGTPSWLSSSSASFASVPRFDEEEEDEFDDDDEEEEEFSSVESDDDDDIDEADDDDTDGDDDDDDVDDDFNGDHAASGDEDDWAMMSDEDAVSSVESLDVSQASAEAAEAGVTGIAGNEKKKEFVLRKAPKGMRLKAKFYVPGKSVGSQCYGCGGIIAKGSDANRSEIVAVSKSQYRKGIKRYALCNRCRKLHKAEEDGDPEEAPIAPKRIVDVEVFKREAAKIKNSPAWVIHVVDGTDIDGSLIRGVRTFVGKNPIVLAVTKCDLLPEDISDEATHYRIKKFIEERAKQKQVNVHEIFLMSALRNSGVAPLVNYIRERLNGKNVYVIGNANTGKTTLVKAFTLRCFDLINFTNIAARKRKRMLIREMPTTSALPGTTLMCVRIPCFKSHRHALFDTPGLFPEQRFHWGEICMQKQVIMRPQICDFSKRYVFERRWRLKEHPVYIVVRHVNNPGDDAGAWYSHLGLTSEPMEIGATIPDTHLLKTFTPREDRRGMFTADCLFIGLGWWSFAFMQPNATIEMYGPKKALAAARPAMFNPIYAKRQQRWIDGLLREMGTTVNRLSEDPEVTYAERFGKSKEIQFRAKDKDEKRGGKPTAEEKDDTLDHDYGFNEPDMYGGSRADFDDPDFPSFMKEEHRTGGKSRTRAKSQGRTYGKKPRSRGHDDGERASSAHRSFDRRPSGRPSGRDSHSQSFRRSDSGRGPGPRSFNRS